MPVFKYRAKKQSGQIAEGNIEAPNEKEAVERLSQIGYMPINIGEEGGTPQCRPQVSLKAKHRVKSKFITVFSRELASLLRSGIPILRAISIIAEQSEDPKLKDILYNISNRVRDGATFSCSLAEYPGVFPPLYVAMIRAGENSGALPDILLRLADYRVKQERILSRFKMAMIYPALMAVLGLGTVIFMLTFVMPRLMGIFKSMGQDLPLPTQILISVSQGLRQWWYWIVLALGFAILILIRHTRTKVGRIALSSLKLHIPLLGKFTLKAELARFSRTMELLIKNGIPILRAIDISIPVLENEIIKARLKESYKELEQGDSFGRSLRDSSLFPLFMSNLIIVGEESGKLEEALGEIAASYERDVNEATKIMGNLLEPLMILTMGLVVGFIVIAMLLPIFEINM